MKTKVLILWTLGVTSAFGQQVTDRRTADIRGGGGDGKCTIEVNVDDVAEVEIDGRNAKIRTISGGRSTIRRFQCNQEMPRHPYDFRFQGVDGRGRQELVHSPENGRKAVVRIEDSKGGSEGYTFDIFWKGGEGGSRNYGRYDQDYGRDYDNRNSSRGGDDWGTGSGWGNSGNFNFSGRGDGTFRDRNGDRVGLRDVKVSIGSTGYATINFDSDRGHMSLSGPVDRRSRHQVYARVNGKHIRGMIEIEMSSRDHVRRIFLRDEGRDRTELDWSSN